MVLQCKNTKDIITLQDNIYHKFEDNKEVRKTEPYKNRFKLVGINELGYEKTDVIIHSIICQNNLD